MQNRESPPEVDRFYAHDIKLAADRNAERVILNIIREQDPEAEIHTEEAGDFEGQSDHIWYIDPLDGTMNYYHGQHHYCTCIACYTRGSALDGLGLPVSSAVFAPDDDELFLSNGRPHAVCNGKPLACSPVDELKDAIIGTSFGSSPETMSIMTDVFSRLLPACRKLRILGSCGLDICQVAAGRLSALYQRNIRVWDFAAAAPMVIKAGGCVDLQRSDRPGHWHILACAPGIRDELAGLLEEVTRDPWTIHY